MAVKITATLDGIEQIKRSLKDAADSVRPLTRAYAEASAEAKRLADANPGSQQAVDAANRAEAAAAKIRAAMNEAAAATRPLAGAMQAASDQSRHFKEVAATAVETTAQEYRNLAAAVEGVKWNEFVAEMTMAAKQEQALAGTTHQLAAQIAGLSAAKRSVAGASGAAAAGVGAVAASSGKSSVAVTQLTYAIQDMLSGGAMGGIKGACLGASNNLSMLAMSMGGVYGAAVGIAISAIPLLIDAFSDSSEAAQKAEKDWNGIGNSLSRIMEIDALSSQDVVKQFDQLAAKMAEMKAISSDLSLTEDQRHEAEKEQVRIGEELWRLGLRISDARKDAATQTVMDNREMAKAIEQGQKLSGIIEQQAEYESQKREADEATRQQRLADMKAELAKSNDPQSVKALASEYAKMASDFEHQQSRATAEVGRSVEEMKKLRDELQKAQQAGDAKKASGIAEQMKKVADEAERARNAVISLGSEKDKLDKQADDAEKRAGLLDAKKKADAAAAKQKPQGAEGPPAWMVDQLSGVAQTLLDNVTPEDIARQLGDQAAAERRKQLTGDKPGLSSMNDVRDVERARQRARSRAMNQMMGWGNDYFSQDQLNQARQAAAGNVTGEEVAKLAGESGAAIGGLVQNDQQVVAAVNQAVQIIAQYEAEAARTNQDIRVLQAQMNAIGNSQRRRSQG